MADPQEELGFTNSTQVFQYIARDIVKDFENNIKLHFVEHVERFLGVLYKKKERLAELDKEGRKQLYTELRTVRDFILVHEDSSQEAKRSRRTSTESPWQPPAVLREHLEFIIPQRPFQKGSVYYDIQCTPQEYFPCLVYMMRWVELQGECIPNLFPLRTSIVPKYVRLDTKIVI